MEDVFAGRRRGYDDIDNILPTPQSHGVPPA